MSNTYDIWRVIQKRPGIGVHAIAKAVGLRKSQADHALKLLRSRGYVTITRMAADGRLRGYTAVLGKRLTQDGRGRHPASAEGLRLSNAFRTAKIKPKPWAIPEPGTALEACMRSWAYRVDVSANSCVNDDKAPQGATVISMTVESVKAA